MPAHDKAQLRQANIVRRRSLSREIITTGSQAMADMLKVWPLYRQAACIMVYLAMEDEPQTDDIIKAALASGKTVCVPLLGNKYGEMTAAVISSMDELVTGRLGLRMPDQAKAMVVDPETIDLILVPGVAFDKGGNRVGMGAGYYDRFLARSKCPLVGMAWSFQICDSIPTEDHDVKMDYLLTEDGVINVQ